MSSDMFGDCHIVGDYRQVSSEEDLPLTVLRRMMMIPCHGASSFPSNSAGSRRDVPMSDDQVVLGHCWEWVGPALLYLLPVICHLYFVNICACGGYSDGVGGRWAGSWGIEADFVAKTKCSIMSIKAADVQVESAKLQLVL